TAARADAVVVDTRALSPTTVTQRRVAQNAWFHTDVSRPGRGRERVRSQTPHSYISSGVYLKSFAHNRLNVVGRRLCDFQLHRAAGRARTMVLECQILQGVYHCNLDWGRHFCILPCWCSIVQKMTELQDTRSFAWFHADVSRPIQSSQVSNSIRRF